MKTLTKLDGSVINLGKGRPKSTWIKLPDGNYQEAPQAPITPSPAADDVAPATNG